MENDGKLASYHDAYPGEIYLAQWCYDPSSYGLMVKIFIYLYDN